MVYLRDIIMILILLTISITDYARKDIDFIPLIFGFIFIITFDALGFNTITFKQAIISGLLFYILFRIIPKMGQGDARLFGLIALFYGGSRTFLIMYIFLIIVSVVGIIMLITKKKKRNDYIALGPFIAISVLINIFYFKDFIFNILWL